MRNDALTVIVSGASAAISVPPYLTWLRQEIDLPIRLLLTHSAERFVQPTALSWYVDELYTSDDPGLNPTELARRSVGLVVLPASANTLAAVAAGLAGSPAQTAILADERPALFFPSMNDSMWAKAVTTRNVATLRADGHTVVDPRPTPVFELWRRENAMGLAMLPPDEATELVIAWLEQRMSSAEVEDVADLDQEAAVTR
ncbi:flavoprotein [Actinophytocola oryzae]|nr:flavoprotein [Actinophytocola oryzae]